MERFRCPKTKLAIASFPVTYRSLVALASSDQRSGFSAAAEIGHSSGRRINSKFSSLYYADIKKDSSNLISDFELVFVSHFSSIQKKHLHVLWRYG
jgi:hypothetical protein